MENKKEGINSLQTLRGQDRGIRNKFNQELFGLEIVKKTNNFYN